MRGSQWALVIVLAIAGLYLLTWHENLPFNHEVVGLGEFHLAHDLFGIILLVVAGLVWWRSRRSSKSATMPMESGGT